jgi:hypothetical protein
MLSLKRGPGAGRGEPLPRPVAVRPKRSGDSERPLKSVGAHQPPGPSFRRRRRCPKSVQPTFLRTSTNLGSTGERTWLRCCRELAKASPVTIPANFCRHRDYAEFRDWRSWSPSTRDWAIWPLRPCRSRRRPWDRRRGSPGSPPGRRHRDTCSQLSPASALK